MTPREIKIIKLGIQNIQSVGSPHERIELLKTGANLLKKNDSTLSKKCAATAACIAEAEACQLRLFESILEDS